MWLLLNINLYILYRFLEEWKAKWIREVYRWFSNENEFIDNLNQKLKH